MRRYFGPAKQNRQSPRMLDGITVYDACAATSERLNTLLKTHDIDVRMAGMGNDHIEGNLIGAWDNALFGWGGLSPLTPHNQTFFLGLFKGCLLYTSPSPRDKRQSRMPSSA